MKFNKFNIALVALAATALVSCKNEDLSENHYDNKLFISATNFTDELLIKAGIEQDSRDIVVGVAKPAGNDIKVKFAAAPELLDTYRKAYYDSEAILLPEENYTIAEPETMIKAGSVTSTPVTVDFVELGLLDRDTRYVLPVTLASVEGIGVLPSARNVYYVFKGAALINVVAGITENRAWPDWKDASPVTNMRTFTLEALINGSAFKNQISTVMGIEGKFLIRCGDAGVDPNQVQVACVNNATSPELRLETNRWYHLAVTFDAGNIAVYLDGVAAKNLDRTYVGTSSVNFGVAHSDESGGKPRCFWIGYSYANDRYLDGMISEVRIWNKALTAEEINAPTHFYEVDPASDGLVAYWKFDDGAGATVKDHTSYGNDLTLEKAPKWTSVSLPETKK